MPDEEQAKAAAKDIARFDTVLLGSGPLLKDVSKRLRLELLEAKSLPSGDVMLRYAAGS